MALNLTSLSEHPEENMFINQSQSSRDVKAANYDRHGKTIHGHVS